MPLLQTIYLPLLQILLVEVGEQIPRDYTHASDSAHIPIPTQSLKLLKGFEIISMKFNLRGVRNKYFPENYYLKRKILLQPS